MMLLLWLFIEPEIKITLCKNVSEVFYHEAVQCPMSKLGVCLCVWGGGGDFKGCYPDVWATYPLWCMLKTIRYTHNGVVTGLNDTHIWEGFQTRSYWGFTGPCLWRLMMGVRPQKIHPYGCTL